MNGVSEKLKILFLNSHKKTYQTLADLLDERGFEVTDQFEEDSFSKKDFKYEKRSSTMNNKRMGRKCGLPQSIGAESF